MFKKLIEGFKDSLIDARFEADLFSSQKPGKEFGEAVYLVHTRGHFSLKVTLKSNFNLPEDNTVCLLLNGEKITEFIVSGEKTVVSLNTKEGQTIPKIGAGDSIELSYDDKIFLNGKFEKD